MSDDRSEFIRARTNNLDEFLNAVTARHYSALDAVKYGGTQTMTDEEVARRRARAEALAPLVERDRLASIARLDQLIIGEH